MKVVLATRNAKKLVELRRVLAQAELPVEVLGLDDVADYPEPAETERSYAGNALLKARAGLLATGHAALADDSGIGVDLLNGMPGVRSARWAGPGRGDQANLDLLIAQLADTDPAERTAHFACAMALALPGGREIVREGRMDGALVLEPRGTNGFGYDPIFVAAGNTVTNAELSAAQKDAISHRGKAVRAMVEVLRAVTAGRPVAELLPTSDGVLP